MSWHACKICEGFIDTGAPESSKIADQKTVNYHEPSPLRKFRITITRKCDESLESAERGLEAPEPAELSKTVDFFVDLGELATVCPYFEQLKEESSLEIATNCGGSWITAPASVASTFSDCRHDYTSPISARNFHAFLESACPSLYGIRPVPVTMSSIVPVLDMLAHFSSEPLLTNCERVLMSTNIHQLDGALLIKLLHRGLCVSLDHRILGRILCVCLMSTAKLADVSQELTGTVGAVFAQAFVANAARSFRHIKPLEQESNLWPEAMRRLMAPTTSSAENEKKEKSGRKGGRRHGCDHSEEAFECILCFDQRCSKCKGEAGFCYKALDNFLYEVRLQLYPHTYRPHLDRDLLREDRINDYILHHQLQPLPR